MAYIIGEPIINIVPARGRVCRICVRFPVQETHTEQVHYRGITIALDPEKLWLIAPDGEPPAVTPDWQALPINPQDEAKGSYATNLLKTAELQAEVEKMAIEDGIDLHAPEKIKQWLETALSRAYDRLSEKGGA